ncbi:MAG: SUMF1/EgtB/PvdO family nonheme iron enzyme [Gammaproteobacteria bacterium]|nr:SUMF1/EgtB/PvdO family nonheme iron enzyme [Gammaproteobacteria bacterium]
MFIDACRNDPGSGTKGAGLNSFVDYDAEGLRILFSTKAGKVSYENSALGHGVFSHYLIEALQGAAARQGLITFRQVADHVRKKVRAWGYSQGQVQVPYEAGDASGDFLLMQTSGPENARLTIRSNVSGDSVYVNGDYKGSTRLDLELPPGNYRVRVSKPGHGDWEQPITLEEGAEGVLRARLVPSVISTVTPPRDVEKEEWREPVTGMEFMWVPGGCFQMGSNGWNSNENEEPVHEVRVDGFWLGKFEVTQGQWKAVMGNNSSNFKNGDNYPAVGVSWNDVQGFIGKLDARGQGGIRLPTEAEWEYACRSGGKQQDYCAGNDVDQSAWYGENSGDKIHRVGEKPA